MSVCPLGASAQKLNIIAYFYFLFLFLAKCGRISIDRNDLLKITGYRDPALTGTNVSFSCLPGSIFTGPNSSTCTKEGLWDPDPTQVVCKGENTTIP